MGRKLQLKNPPLVEMFLGVSYKNQPIPLVSMFHFYNDIKEDYPKIQELQTMPILIEYPDRQTEIIPLNGFQTRKLFFSKDNETVIQIQSNKINFNWRKISEDSKYTNFSDVSKYFYYYLRKLEELNSLEFERNQYEVSYINHIKLKDFQNHPNSILSLTQSLEDFNHLDLKFSYPMRDLGGNATVSVQKGIKMEEEILIVQFILRGYLPKKRIETWFNEAHDIILNLFKSTFSEKAIQFWGEI